MTISSRVGYRFEYLTNGTDSGGQIPGRMLPASVRAGPRRSSPKQIRPQGCGGAQALERTIDMARFIYLYRGPATPVSDPAAPEDAERMAAFGAWMAKLGPALVDVGRPFGTSASVRDDGTEGTAGDLIGYTIVEADDLAAAKAFTGGLPFLSGSDGKCAVEIFELLPM
jgi:hypothetical protein